MIKVNPKSTGRKKFPYCPYCADGWVCDSKPLPTAYRCRCEAGFSLPKYVSQWRGELVRVRPNENEIYLRGMNVIKEIVTGAVNKMSGS